MTGGEHRREMEQAQWASNLSRDAWLQRRPQLLVDLMNILYLTPERHPANRPDVAALFGKYIPRYGLVIDLVALAAPGDQTSRWPGGKTLVATATGRVVLDELRVLCHRARALFMLGWRHYDGIIVRDMPTLACFALIACRLRRVAFFYWMSFPITEAYQFLADMGPRKIGWVRWAYAGTRAWLGRLVLKHVVMRHAEHIFVQSEAMKASWAAKGFDGSRISAVPMGVDLEETESQTAVPASDPRMVGREALVYVGSLSTARRLDIMIEAFAMAWRKRPTLMLVMVGRGELPGQEEELRAVAARAGVADQILWAGWQPRHEAMRFVRAAVIGLSFIPRGDLYDLSSPTKVCEYLAMGVPALVNDLPDQVLVARRSGAAHVVQMEPERIAEDLLALVADPEALRRMAEFGPSYVARERSYAVIAPQVAGTLRQVIGGARPGSASAS